jgi:hypothetical protein
MNAPSLVVGLLRLPIFSPASRVLVALLLVSRSAFPCGAASGADSPASPDPNLRIGRLVVSDDFDHGLDLWKAELEKGGKVEAHDGGLEIDVSGGCTLWLKPLLAGPLTIEYQSEVIKAGGPNDRASDMNCFWMARDSRSPADILATVRSGAFSDYDQLNCYYVGLGGNGNTTTRFRRYIGEKGNRPILPEHDLSAKEFLIVPNVVLRIQLVAAGQTIAYYRNGRRLFVFQDPAPYTTGWFGLRTTENHMVVRRLRIYSLARESPPLKSAAH